MKPIIFLALMIFSLKISAQDKNADETTYNPNAVKDSSKKSIKSAVVENIGNASFRINYYSPAVRGRNIWGGLVSYNEVWVTGAHKATDFEMSKTIMVNGKEIAAGKYALFTIPGKDEWIFIINKNYQQHLADDYDAREDIIRVTLIPIVTEQSLERLQYFIVSTEKNKGTISMQWEKIKIEVPFTLVDE